MERDMTEKNLKDITHEAFAKCLNQEFTLIDPEDKNAAVHTVKLTDVDYRPGSGMSREVAQQMNLPFREPFSLLFETTEDICLPQKNYKVSNPEFGEAVFFLVPLDPTSGKLVGKAEGNAPVDASKVKGCVLQGVFN